MDGTDGTDLREGFERLLRFGRREATSLILLALVAGAAWGFVELADEVVEGETRTMDERLLLALRTASDPGDPLGPLWFEEMARDLTALGGVTILSLITLAVGGLLWLQGKRRAVLGVAVAIIGALIINYSLKGWFDRPRPELVQHELRVYSASFPSGHSLMSTATYLTLGALLARFQTGRGLKIYIFAVALLLALAVGCSRVYLGVHWPSDVLAGWSLGAAWALLCWLGARLLQQRGRLDTDPEEPDAPALLAELRQPSDDPLLPQRERSNVPS